jgi:hypothetical protein
MQAWMLTVSDLRGPACGKGADAGSSVPVGGSRRRMLEPAPGNFTGHTFQPDRSPAHLQMCETPERARMQLCSLEPAGCESALHSTAPTSTNALGGTDSPDRAPFPARTLARTSADVRASTGGCRQLQAFMPAGLCAGADFTVDVPQQTVAQTTHGRAHGGVLSPALTATCMHASTSIITAAAPSPSLALTADACSPAIAARTPRPPPAATSPPNLVTAGNAIVTTSPRLRPYACAAAAQAVAASPALANAPSSLATHPPPVASKPPPSPPPSPVASKPPPATRSCVRLRGGAPSAATEPVVLPAQWKATTCPLSGKTYYYHIQTLATQWDPPCAAATTPISAAATSMAPPPTPTPARPFSTLRPCNSSPLASPPPSRSPSPSPSPTPASAAAVAAASPKQPTVSAPTPPVTTAAVLQTPATPSSTPSPTPPADTTAEDAARANRSVLRVGSHCWHRHAKQWGCVAEVHYDSLPPYYTVTMADGSERSTTRARLDTQRDLHAGSPDAPHAAPQHPTDVTPPPATRCAPRPTQPSVSASPNAAAFDIANHHARLQRKRRWNPATGRSEVQPPPPPVRATPTPEPHRPEGKQCRQRRKLARAHLQLPRQLPTPCEPHPPPSQPPAPPEPRRPPSQPQPPALSAPRLQPPPPPPAPPLPQPPPSLHRQWVRPPAPPAGDVPPNVARATAAAAATARALVARAELEALLARRCAAQRPTTS